MTYINPGSEYVRIHGLLAGVEDVMRYAAFLRSEAGVSDEPPIDLSRIYEKFSIPVPRRAELPGQQGLLLNPDTGLIIINENEIETRQRFTEAHELMELMFSEMPGSNSWAARDDGKFKRGKKEALCNRGAAELMMPRSSFLPRVVEQGVSISTADQLAEEFHVSPTAVTVNMGRIGPGEHTVVLWQHRHKPSELKKMSSGDQLSLYGGAAGLAPLKRLRVAWSIGKDGAPYVPPHKSVEESSSIYRAWETKLDNEGMDHLKLGPLSGRCTCENHPEEVEGQQVVLSLLHLPDDRDCSKAPSIQWPLLLMKHKTSERRRIEGFFGSLLVFFILRSEVFARSASDAKLVR